MKKGNGHQDSALITTENASDIAMGAARFCIVPGIPKSIESRGYNPGVRPNLTGNRIPTCFISNLR
jgi:hypothetical protein